ncbi:MAG TPA: GGDEF domain-containing protein [Patescibacteria group bacterium]|nr:GGDEF domain-containing protein [Patescibacteria group bacterium]
MTLQEIIGKNQQFTIRHRILNTILLFGALMSFWSAAFSCLTQDSALSGLSCGTIGGILSGVFYLSRFRQMYILPIVLAVGLTAVIVPLVWISSGGSEGRTPFYLMLFSPMSVVLMTGYKRFVITAILTAMTVLMLVVEYSHPEIIRGYSDPSMKFVDVGVAMVTAIVINSIFFDVILRHYVRQHQMARQYLEESEAARQKLQYIGFHDTLTGLYNRRFYEIEVARLEKEKSSEIAVFVVDVDGLKFVNDTMGHFQGDSIIIRAAESIRAAFPGETRIFRTGGDEFVVLLAGKSPAELETHYRKIQEQLRRGNENNANSLNLLQLSVGYSSAAERQLTVQELLLEAENRMYREKTFHHSRKGRSMLQIIQKMMVARDDATDQHCERLQVLMVAFARVCPGGWNC